MGSRLRGDQFTPRIKRRPGSSGANANAASAIHGTAIGTLLRGGAFSYRNDSNSHFSAQEAVLQVILANESQVDRLHLLGVVLHEV